MINKHWKWVQFKQWRFQVYNTEELSALFLQSAAQNDCRLSAFKCISSHFVCAWQKCQGSPCGVVRLPVPLCVCMGVCVGACVSGRGIILKIINSRAGRWRSEACSSHCSILTTDGAFEIFPQIFILKTNKQTKQNESTKLKGQVRLCVMGEDQKGRPLHAYICERARYEDTGAGLIHNGNSTGYWCSWWTVSWHAAPLRHENILHAKPVPKI